MNRKFLYPLIIIVVTVGLYYTEGYIESENIAPSQATDVEETIPTTTEFDASFLPTSTTGSIVAHDYYTLSYAEAFEQAEWVAYELAKKHLSSNKMERPLFVEDKKVKTGSADYRNYKGSGYDKGHLCPAADRKFTFEAFNETFLTSNISPQDHQFNAGIWNFLEQKTRYWARKYDGVYVVTGGVLKQGLPSIGKEEVAVPAEFYKIIMDSSEGTYKVIAFLIPHEPVTGSYFNYVVTIDEIEARTGIDFFPKLSEEIAIPLESTIDLKGWKNR